LVQFYVSHTPELRGAYIYAFVRCVNSIGSLTFATEDFSGLINILLMVSGGILMLAGVVQLIYSALTRNQGGHNTNPSSSSSDKFDSEMHGGSTFNPDSYGYQSGLDDNGRY
jgi:hypothetical protein